MRVLVVEDEKKVAAAVRRGLEAEGFAVDVALTGTDGLWMATESAYDVIVLDIMLPGMNGFDVCAQVRDAGIWTPILMLTAKDGEYDQAEALDTGADDYLTKPFSFVVLLARLRALVRRKMPARPTILSVGDVTLDPATHEVLLAGAPIALTPREYALLEYFLRHPGRVVSKIELLDNVWDATEDTDPNAVEVYVGYLRRKVGRGVLRTVRGSGYRLGT